LLTERDLNHEQAYFLAKNRLHNRYLHGTGVVCGLQVVCSECAGWVTVKSGYAIDPCGNDVIVCQDYAFNVLQAIQNCAPPAQAANCAPLRYVPSPSCQNMTQTWCITIQYQEQQSNLVTPLMQVPSNGASSCAGSSPGGTTGCSAGTASPSCGCSSSASQTSSSTPTGACEATRILEGFQLGVIPAPSSATESEAAPGTFLYQFLQCYTTLEGLISSPPSLNGFSNAAAYQAALSYQAQVESALASFDVTNCQPLSSLSSMIITAPPASGDKGDYIGCLQNDIAKITQAIVAPLRDCLCYALLPACAPAPCANCLILACVTVQNNQVTNICNFGERRQLITFPTLYYYLEPFYTLVRELLGRLCCDQEEVKRLLGRNNLFQKDDVTSAGVTTPAMLQTLLGHVFTQKLGAGAVNALVPNAKAADLRVFVGKPLKDVQAALQSQGWARKAFNVQGTGLAARAEEGNTMELQGVYPQAVDGDPSWDAAAVAASAQFAPSAVSPGQPLMVYTQANKVVGFDVVEPTAYSVLQLQEQVKALQSQVQSMQQAATTSANPPAGPGGAAPGTTSTTK